MKRHISNLSVLFMAFMVMACGNDAATEENRDVAQNIKTLHADSGAETEPESEARLDDAGEKGADSESDNIQEAESEAIPDSMEEMEEDTVETGQIYIQVGETALTAVLENNESAKELKELLADGALTISASNYGGFEKVCSLGTELVRNDSQTTTHAGDICLYNGSQIVIFYGSNSWAYTRLGRITDVDEAELERVLSGEETEITLSLK